MNKPEMKAVVGIKSTNIEWRAIYFNTTSDIAAAQLRSKEFKEFGHVSDMPTGTYSLFVDGGYDFEEVVAYLTDYGQEGQP